MLHYSKIVEIVDPVKGKKSPKFNLKFVKRCGSVVTATNCICTSSYFANNTINIRFENGQVRKIRTITILEFNNQKVIA